MTRIRTLVFTGVVTALAAVLLVGNTAGATPPVSYTLGRVVVQQNVTLINDQTGTGDFLYNPVVGIQTRPVTVDCPIGKVPLSGGGKITTTAVGIQYADRPVMVLADSRPTATGWSLIWLATANMPGSNGTEFTANVAVVCANP